MVKATEADGATASPDQPAETILQQISRTYYDVLPAFERFVGMSRARWQMLNLLAREDGVSQSVLAQRLKIDGAAITRQVKQLEEESLVSRRIDPHDNRITRVALTEMGWQTVEAMRGKRERFESLVTAGLEPDEIVVMERCLRHIRENVQGLAQGQ